MKNIICSLAVIMLCLTVTKAQSVDSLGISVTTEKRQYVFTNKEAGTYYGNVNTHNAGGWQGWFINTEKVMHDYSITIPDYKILDRNTASSIVYPHLLIRNYSNSVIETFSMADSINALIIKVSRPSAKLSLQLTDEFTEDTTTASASMMQRWIRTHSTLDFAPSVIIVSTLNKENETIFIILAEKNFHASENLIRNVTTQYDELISNRKKRMQTLLDRSPVQFNNKELTMALAWAKIQIDALIMNQTTDGKRTKGIFAGLPWFNNYWGRDSFISLPGATYVTGSFTDAKDILLSFAKFQEIDSTNTNYGRIPNLATPQSIVYNTADGTPWFIKSLYEYVNYSGDTAVIRNLYPNIRRSIEGTMKFHMDSLGFLTHGDAETWMDAVGPTGPWSPRGNRANDIQALWHKQLTIGTFCAAYLFDYNSVSRWIKTASTLEYNFNRFFIDTTHQLIYDHLNIDGTPSSELRPNQLFCVDMLIPEDVRQHVIQMVLHNLVYEYGTATLAQTDSNFHPYHEYPPYYVKDAAYHNGIVWTWLNGQMTYTATRYDLEELIYPVLKNMTHQILDRGCVGTLSELLDAHPRQAGSEPNLSGTYSQAWSLAEFIRSIYQDYLGISVDVTSKALRVNPKLPIEINSVQCEQRIANGSCAIQYDIHSDTVSVTMHPKTLSEDYNINYLYVYPTGNAVMVSIQLDKEGITKLIHTENSITIFNKNKRIFETRNDSKIFLKNFSDKKIFAGITLAMPDTQKKFPALRGPGYPLLTHDQVKRIDHSSRLLFDQSDSIGDDTGPTGKYSYPANTHFKKGILDITKASFRYDKKFLYCTLTFVNLQNPGWHPEYGFQLTLAAIAIKTGKGMQRNVGINSQYMLDSSRAFDKLIVVGGGISLIDAAGKILCEYIPKNEDALNPLGNCAERNIEFSIPLKYLGTPSLQWKITILVGAQDDHGGAGVGEFRSVQQDEVEWQGGGKQSPDLPNIYDVLLIN